MSAFGAWLGLLALGLLAPLAAAGCGADVCDEAREAFCEKACECADGGCVARLAQAGLQLYDNMQECLDLAGPQICDSEGTADAADACTAAVAEMDSCGGTVAPEACTPFQNQGTGTGTP